MKRLRLFAPVNPRLELRNPFRRPGTVTRHAAVFESCQDDVGPTTDLAEVMQVEAEQDLPEVKVDPDRMAQVLGNLVSNALRYTPAGGQISLGAAQRGDNVLLSVQDNWAGIPPEALPHIFERFYRGDPSRPGQGGESGLGLAIARSIVEAHGGTISAHSTLGEGTTFTVLLPGGHKSP